LLIDSNPLPLWRQLRYLNADVCKFESSRKKKQNKAKAFTYPLQIMFHTFFNFVAPSSVPGALSTCFVCLVIDQ